MSDPQLSPERATLSLPLTHWDQPIEQDAQGALEQGKVLLLPALGFALQAQELALLTPALVDPKRKNISYNAQTGRLRGLASADHTAAVSALLARYHRDCLQLVATLFPAWHQRLHAPVNTLRLHPVNAWREASSWRKDDSRLHVDAFPSRPNHGERILRIFTNINPHGESRQWRIGEPFPQLAQRFLPRLKGYSPWICRLQRRLGITKGLRSHYDHLMLQLHDAMKADGDYQQHGPQLALDLPAGSSWICFSDQTPHAAMSGQYMLEQTFLLAVTDMQQADHAPLRVLENGLGKKLV